MLQRLLKQFLVNARSRNLISDSCCRIMMKVCGAVYALIVNPVLIVLINESVFDMLVDLWSKDVLLIMERRTLVHSRKGGPATILRFVVQYVFRDGRE